MRIVTLSHCVTNVPISGHPFWFHRALRNAASLKGIDYEIVGPLNEESAGIRGVLHHPSDQRSISKLFIWSRLQADILRLENLLGQVETIIHVYECGFREFILVSRVLARNPNTRALLNLSFSDPWHLVFQRKALFARIARLLFRFCRRILSGRLVCTAETLDVAERFSLSTRTPFFEYPLFAANVDKNSRITASKSRDILYFPQNSSENTDVLSAIERLPRHEEYSIAMVPKWGYMPSFEDRESLRSMNVELLEGILSGAEYLRVLGESRVAIFPYFDPVYRFASSGRVLEAAMAGCTILAPDWTLSGIQVRREGWGYAFTKSSLSETINCALRDSRGGTEKRQFRDAAWAVDRILSLSEAHQTNEEEWSKRQTCPLLGASFLLGSGWKSWGPALLNALQSLFMLAKRSTFSQEKTGV